MTENEKQLLGALAWMCEQYIGDRAGGLDHMSMSAGERAREQLLKYGLVDSKDRDARWTDAGQALLKAT